MRTTVSLRLHLRSGSSWPVHVVASLRDANPVSERPVYVNRLLSPRRVPQRFRFLGTVSPGVPGGRLHAAGAVGGARARGGPRARCVRAPAQAKSSVPMVLIPAGEFTMGDEGGDDDEKPAHRVALSAFYMDVHEVTQQAFQEMMGRNPAKSAGPDKPVERVSWFGAIQYCNLRSAREGLQPCYDLKTQACDFTANGYRLPTEAEWEYACRAGTATRWSFGDQPGDLGKHGWYKGEFRQDHAPRRPEAAESVGPVRPARERGRVVPRLLRRELRGGGGTGPRPDRPGRGHRAGAAGRQLERQRRGLPQLGPAERIARLRRRLLRLRGLRLPLRPAGRRRTGLTLQFDR